MRGVTKKRDVVVVVDSNITIWVIGFDNVLTVEEWNDLVDKVSDKIFRQKHE
jgi:hypothetical protein